ncbi:MAG: phosphatase [Bradyrhizobium sp.]|nr:phosphatase [Bradyrhizobium sp.]
MRALKTCLMASVAVAMFGAAEQANAQTFVYGGGATFPSKVYRQMMDCLTYPVDGNVGFGGVVDPGQSDNGRNVSQLALAPSCPFYNITGFFGSILYAPVGSGAGKAAFAAHNAASTGPLTIPSASNTIPYVSRFTPTQGGYGYPSFHFAGSDDVVVPSDLTAHSGSPSNPVNATRGYWLQVPALAGAVAIPYNGTDGNGVALNLSTPGVLKLSRRALCGIVSGHITKWDNSVLTTDNGGVALGTGNITFVHRSDSSGTNYLFTNAMVTQCNGVFGPNSESDATAALYSFPWTDKRVPVAQCPNALPIQGSNQVNWPDVGGTNNQCGNPVANPGGGRFLGGSGTSGVVATIHATPGSIGYASPDFVDPVVPIGTGPADGLAVASLQNQFDIDNATGSFHRPTYQNANTAMQTAIPVFDDTSRANPLNWSRQMIVPNPLLADAYPIAGFTMLNFYQCYANSNVYDVLVTYINFLYGNAIAKNILHDQQFSEIPDLWYTEILKLVNPGNPLTGFNKAGEGACAGKSGA